MSSANSTLLFIPDISGFTDFVNTTEISHSRHIISELLEIIINSDENNMHVSEVEGDAILFYKDDVPSVQKLIEQCRKTFLNFHTHLQRYNTERICRCGACETAANLSLKFVIHAGQVEKINIKDHRKLHGSDVILAHRLLKNSVGNSEYILFSNSFEVKEQSLKEYKWAELETGKEYYENLGEIDYSSIRLHPLFNQIKETSLIQFPTLGAQKIQIRSLIKAPLDKVYENFTDYGKRVEWNENIKDIRMHGRDLNASGEIHTCLVRNDSFDIETIGRLEENNKVIYGERLNSFKGLEDIISIYTFEADGKNTVVNTEIDFKPKSLFTKLFKSFIRKKIQSNNENALVKLKEVSEKASGNY